MTLKESASLLLATHNSSSSAACKGASLLALSLILCVPDCFVQSDFATPLVNLLVCTVFNSLLSGVGKCVNY